MSLLTSRHAFLKKTLQRRVLLKALGLGIAAPLAIKMSRLATAQDMKRPTRLFLFYVPHGLPLAHWEVGGEMNFSKSGVGILSALEPYREYVTVMRGVGIKTSTNHAAIRSSFTGTESSNSIDYEIAKQLKTTSHVLGAYANPPGAGSDAQLIKHGGWVDPIANPADALDELFPGLTAGGAPPPTTDMSDVEFRNQALALTEGELETMQSELSDLTGEANKLNIHLESLRGFRAAAEGGGGVGVISCKERPALASAESMKGKDPYDVANLTAVVEGHLEAAAYSMLCGTSRIVTMQNLYANGQVMMDFPGGPGIAKNHHDPLSHTGKENETQLAEFATAQKWFYTKLVEKFISVLDADDPADPGRKVLDNTVVMTMSEIVDGSNHTSDYNKDVWDVAGGPREVYIPTLLIGKGGGTIKGGQSVYVPGADHRDLLATVAHAMGVQISDIGGKSVSPIQEVLA